MNSYKNSELNEGDSLHLKDSGIHRFHLKKRRGCKQPSEHTFGEHTLVNDSLNT